MGQNQLHPLDVTFDEEKGLQCPNCKGYRVKNLDSNTFHAAMTILTVGMWLLVWIPIMIFSPAKTEDNFRCKLCGYEWTAKK